jgi:hypothetical protein
MDKHMSPTFSGEVSHRPLTVAQQRQLDRLLTRFWLYNTDENDDDSAAVCAAVQAVRQSIAGQSTKGVQNDHSL